MGTGDPRQTELLDTLRKGVDSALAVVTEIDRGLLACSRQLRVDPGEATFKALSSEISNLGDLVSLMQVIKDGTAHLASRPVPEDAFASIEKSLDLFREMNTAMEGKDWVTLADLIQYELSPLLSEGEKGLAGVRDLLASP